MGPNFIVTHDHRANGGAVFVEHFNASDEAKARVRVGELAIEHPNADVFLTRVVAAHTHTKG